MKSTDKKTLLTIQALRGIAAMLIVILHGIHETEMESPPMWLRIGVDIFFVISGFIMVYTSAGKFGDKRAWKDFMKHRMVRIVPLCWFYTSILVVVSLVMPSALQTIKFEPVHVLLSYLFIPHKNPAGGLHPFFDLAWTLNYEMYFYIIFAALLFLPMRRMLWALTIFFVFSVVSGLYLTDSHPALFFWTRPVILEFVGGAWLGYAFLRGWRLKGYWLYVLLLVGLGLLFFEYNPLEERPINQQVAALLFVTAAILPLGMAEARVWRPLLGLGNASYSIYLSHPFILAAFEIIGHRFLPPETLFILTIPAALAGGYILYLVVEKPLLSATKRVFLTHEKALRPERTLPTPGL